MDTKSKITVQFQSINKKRFSGELTNGKQAGINVLNSKGTI